MHISQVYQLTCLATSAAITITTNADKYQLRQYHSEQLYEL